MERGQATFDEKRPRLTDHHPWPSNLLILAIGLCGRYFYDLHSAGKAGGEKELIQSYRSEVLSSLLGPL